MCDFWQNLYNDVAKQGCNVFLAPSAGAGNTVDWISMHSSIRCQLAPDETVILLHPLYR